MTKEYYIDGIGNISVQGPVVTLTMTRASQGANAENNVNDEVLHITMTGQNLLNLTNILNNTIKRLAQRNKTSIDENKDSKSAKIKDETNKKN